MDSRFEEKHRCLLSPKQWIPTSTSISWKIISSLLVQSGLEVDGAFNKTTIRSTQARGPKNSWDIRFEVMDLLANSPDLNPIEDMWGVIKNNVKRTPKDLAELKRLMVCWICVRPAHSKFSILFLHLVSLSSQIFPFLEILALI